MIDDLLMSPVRKRVLCNPTNFSFNPRSVILAKLNRAELGDFDALVLGLFLMAHFKGQVVVPDFCRRHGRGRRDAGKAPGTVGFGDYVQAATLDDSRAPASRIDDRTKFAPPDRARNRNDIRQMAP